MKALPGLFFVLLCLLILPANQVVSAAEHQVVWQFNPPVAGSPKGSVDLLVDGGAYPIIPKSSAPYQKLAPSEFSGYGIPREAILAAYSWHAGFGDVLYVLHKKGRLEVYRREMDESETSRFPVKKIYTVYL